MSEILSFYHRLHPATWVYLSSLLTIALYFKFNRVWSMRNLDLVLLILLAPGLLLVSSPPPNPAAATQHASPPDPQTGLEAGSSHPAAPRPSRPMSALRGKIVFTQSAASASAPGPPIDPTNPTPDGSPPTPTGLPEDAGATDDGVAAAEDAAGEPNPTVLPSSGTGPATKPRATVIGPTPEKSPAVPPWRRKDPLDAKAWGYIWLFVIGGIWTVRLLVDPSMVRRPLLEPNLSIGGMTFLGCALFAFLMANVITSDQPGDINPARFGPGYHLLYKLPAIPTGATADPALTVGEYDPANVVAAKAIAILANAAIVLGLVMIGRDHFDNIRTGVGVGTLYLLLPYSAFHTGRIDHVLPAALLVWAIYFYRRPIIAGAFIGLASIVYYPLYLLPLWISFYWERGKWRYISGVASMLAVLIVLLMISFPMDAPPWQAAFWRSDFARAVQAMFGLWKPLMEGFFGFWNYFTPHYRIPVLAAFMAMCGSFALWPAQKNLGTLLCCSGAVMLGSQFWQGHDGGLYMAWYLPMTLLTVFRPNLEDRVALAVLGEGWFPRRKTGAISRAA